MKKALINALSIVAFLWIILIIKTIIPFDLNRFGIYPRTIIGLRGVILAPFIHANMMHLLSNTVPLFILLTTLFWQYNKVAIRVLLLSILFGGLLVWGLARPAFHIGASGVIFSLVAFFIFSGLFQKNLKSILIAIFVFFLYGGIVWGVFPNQPGVSWESHLFGFLSGIGIAYIYKDNK